jgi:hypothetical protein
MWYSQISNIEYFFKKTNHLCKTIEKNIEKINVVLYVVLFWYHPWYSIKQPECSVLTTKTAKNVV